jgi:acyl-coenzyme A synthetase/AMP-(fatty) acid ligase
LGNAAGNTATPYEDAVNAASVEDPAINIDGKDPFIVMITSGTTGFPKGCVIDHETYALRSLNNAISKGLNDRERGLLTLPLHFNAGRGSAMSLLYLGGTLFLLDKFNDDLFVDILEREQITYTILVPALCQRLLRHPKIERIDKSSLTYVGITGGHLTPQLAEEIMRKLSPRVYEAYASTDCGQIAILKPADRATHADIDGWGQNKVLFGTDFPVIEFRRATAEVKELKLKDVSRENLVWKNAARVYDLKPADGFDWRAQS